MANQRQPDSSEGPWTIHVCPDCGALAPPRPGGSPTHHHPQGGRTFIAKPIEVVPKAPLDQAEAQRDALQARLEELVGRVERDRREPDKILCHLQSAKRALIEATLDTEQGVGK